MALKDNYRIYLFKDIDGKADNVDIPAHIPPCTSAMLPPESSSILASHFLRCLDVHFVGGDITSDYAPGEIDNTIYELIGDSKNRCVAPMEDERWQTPLGKEILRAYLESKVPYRSVV